jgi:hypothetical protein
MDDDPRQRVVSRSYPAIQVQGDLDDDWLTGYLTATIRLAEALDQQTLELALRIAPPEWWDARTEHVTADGAPRAQ